MFNLTGLNSLVDFLSSIWAIILYISLITGFIFSWVIIFTRDAKLEKIFHNIIKRASDKLWIINYTEAAPKHVIVTSEDKKSEIRAILKKFFLRIIFRKKIQEKCIIVIRNEHERKVKLLEKSFSYIPGAELLDYKFIASLIQYFSYKYSLNYPHEFTQNELDIIRKNFESSSKGAIVQELDNREFGIDIVLNPPPEAKGLLSILILPLIDYCYKQICAEGELNPLIINEKRDRAMELIDGIYYKKYGIIFIGSRGPDSYIKLILENAGKLRGFILGASDYYQLKMNTTITMIIPELRKLWGDDYVDLEEIHGFHEIKGKNYHYLIIRRGKKITRAELNKLIKKGETNKSNAA